MNCLISVVVPVYNMEKYLERCVDSICKQSYKNIEIILIDDGSADKSGAMCDEAGKSDDRIKVIHKKNGGLSAARNTGIENASGEYICFIDSDDYLSPYFISSLYNACVESDCEIALCGVKRTDGSDQPCGDENVDFKVYSNIEMLENMYNNMHMISIIACNKLYKKEIFNDIRYPEGQIREDEAVAGRVYYNAKKVAVTDKYMYFYYENADSITRRSYSLSQLDILKSIKQRMDFFKEKGLDRFYDKDSFLYLVQLFRGYYNVSKFIENNKKYKKKLKEEINTFYKKVNKSKWSISRRMLMAICKRAPILYSGVYLKIK